MTSHPPRRPAPWQPDVSPANVPGGPGHLAPPAGWPGAPAPFPGRPGGAVPPAARPTATAPLTHAEFYRTPRNRWWKGLLSILVLGAAIALFSIALSLLGTLVDLLLGSTTLEELGRGQITLTPVLLLATNLSLIASAAVAVLLHRYLHRQPVGTLHSVAGRFRWDWLGRASVVVVPLFVAYVAVIVLVETPGPVVLDATAWAFLAIVLLTTPLQAASEEYIFRGVIQRAAGSWVSGAVPSFVLGTLVSAVLFSLAHFATDGWLIAYYLVFGIAMSLLTQLTGGLEAASLVHAANNVLLFLVSATTGQMSEGMDRSAGVGGPFMLAPMLVIAAVAAVLILLARRRGLQRRAVPPATA
ncbi:CPBP family intramembrane glutamic endopeptidase [uncultured Kocuria sp.]|uniref:CPBP family intramembrane glutamic endopeptidase n=1 Tax=uncultured Kocuria sp. TaxID=259305 RepID=UPI00260F8391|nr:CPBP family glutamic-type intramembrane protease [uncultured Kocuria sp.]